MATRTLYLVRHGQRLDAVKKHWQGADDNKYDSPLSDRGLEQAQKVGERLKQEPIDHIFVSPYLRALQTAQAIAEKLDLSFYVDHGVGEWQGRSMMPQQPNILPPEQRAADFPYMLLYHETGIYPQWPETVAQVFDRYKVAVTHLLDTYQGNLLIVGHGRTVTGIPHVLTGKPESHFKYELAGLTKLALIDGEWCLQLNSDVSHLTGETMPQFI